MQILKITALAVGSLLVLVSCQSISNSSKDLSNLEVRNEIMYTIANDSVMAQEMIGAMMNSQNGMMKMQNHQGMMMLNHNAMTERLKHNPMMMSNMMTTMMERAKGDTTLMSGMISAMMQNHQMREMMQIMNCNGITNNMYIEGMENDPN